MKDVASSINEMKRKVEKLGNLAEWQLTVDGWEVRSLLIVAFHELLSGHCWLKLCLHATS